MVSLIYLTGDIHQTELDRFLLKNFPQQKTMTKDDYVICLGDYGGYWKWYNEKELNLRKSLTQRNFTFMFVDGNHENFDIVNSLDKIKMFGGTVGIEQETGIIHLQRGQVYIIDNKKILTLGGADSIDKHNRRESISWWKEERPNNKELFFTMESLEKNDFTVDYILTHTCPYNIFKQIVSGEPISNYEKILQQIADKTTFKKWWFAHHHIEQQFGKYECLYKNIKNIEEVLQ